jgi:hypothetical protein
MSKEKTTEATTPEAPKINFGFAVLIDEDGNVFVERTKEAFALPVERDATLLEVRRYTSEVLMDLQAQSAAEYVTLRLSGIGKAAVVDEATPSA